MSRGLVVLCVNVDESRAAMEAFLKEHPVTFAVVRDKGKALVRAVNIPSMPTLLVLDRERKVRAIHGSLSSAEARDRCIRDVEQLLTPGPAPSAGTKPAAPRAAPHQGG